MSPNKQSNPTSSTQKGKNEKQKRKQTSARQPNAAFIKSLDDARAYAASKDSKRLNPTFVPPSYLQVAHQILGPATCPDNIVATPNSCRRFVVPRRYRRVVDFKPGLDHFTVAMTPNLFAPGFINAGTVETIPSVLPGYLAFSGHCLDAGAVAPLPVDGKFYSGSETLLARSIDITDSAAVVKHGFKVVGTGAMTYSIYNKEEQFVTVEVWNKVTATNLWSLNQTLHVPPRTTRMASYSTVSDAIAFATNGNHGPKAHGIHIDFQNPVAQYTAAVGEGFAPAFGEQITDLGITEGRVISMSLKVTNTSAQLQRAGNISIGRVPGNFSPFGAVSEHMSQLPDNRRYQDAVDHGGYVFWVPEQGDEWEFDSVYKKAESYIDANYLLAHINGLMPDSSFRLTFGWVVEFYTPSQNFPKMPTPIDSPYWREIQSLLVNMDAACCNPESAGMFRRFLNSGIQSVQQAREHYGRNRDTYDMLLALAKHLAGLAL